MKQRRPFNLQEFQCAYRRQHEPNTEPPMSDEVKAWHEYEAARLRHVCFRPDPLSGGVYHYDDGSMPYRPYPRGT